MARIRTIKPSFWQDELIGMMPATHRLVFIGLFSLADDEGRARSNAAYVRSEVFRYDDSVSTADVEEILLELHRISRIRIYGMPGQRYLLVTNFAKHQYIQKPQPSQIPAPGRFHPLLSLEGDDEQEIPDALWEPSDTVTSGKGMEGSGMDLELTHSSPASPSTSVAVKPKKLNPEDDPQVRACFDWYCQEWGKVGAFKIDLDRKRAAAIQKALKEHGSEKVAAVIRGHRLNEWRHGQLSRNDIKVLLRPDNIDGGMELAAKAAGEKQANTLLTLGNDDQLMGY